MSLAITTVFFTETAREVKKSFEEKSSSLNIVEKTRSFIGALKTSLNPYSQSSDYQPMKVSSSSDKFTYYPPSHFKPFNKMNYPASLDEERVSSLLASK